jgi:hypothetical protein
MFSTQSVGVPIFPTQSVGVTDKGEGGQMIAVFL